MNTNCKCGGKFRRTDIEPYYDARYKRTMYRDVDNAKATWRCSGCGATRTQRKRQPTAKETK